MFAVHKHNIYRYMLSATILWNVSIDSYRRRSQIWKLDSNKPIVVILNWECCQSIDTVHHNR